MEMQMKYTRVIWVIGLVLFLRPSFGWGETEHHAQRCHIGPSAELVVLFLLIGGLGKELIPFLEEQLGDHPRATVIRTNHSLP
jgi:hypothetical protein